MAAGFFIGCACACKWDAIWYLVAFVALALAWDVGARRAAGIGHFWRGALLRDGKWLPLTFGVLPLAVYIASWTGWFASSLGYDRNYAAAQGFRTPVLSALYSLYEYHVQMLQFSVGLHTHHPYESQPWDWLVLSRPVAYYYSAPTSGAGCSVAPHCSREVLAIGTPAHLVGGDPGADLLRAAGPGWPPITVAPGGRGAPVQPADGLQAAARHAQPPVRDLQGVHVGPELGLKPAPRGKVLRRRKRQAYANSQPSCRTSGQRCRIVRQPKESPSGKAGRTHMARPSRSWWDSARQIVQLLALVADEAIKLIDVLRGH